jgi:uncharacterized protein (UPF0276 family)
MWRTGSSPAVGAAYCAYTPSFVKANPNALDYVEVPFELLCHDPSVSLLGDRIPIVLHCASLSVASPDVCSKRTVEQVQEWVKSTSSPWIGEHLAFITADREEAGGIADAYAPGEPYNIGYTVSPAMNSASLRRVIEHLRYYSSQFPVQILIENSPLYFRIPSSTMSQADFMTAILEGCSSGLLLDLAHLLISSETMGFDPEVELERYPLEHVVEIHISGVDTQADGTWDNHALRAPERVYRLLAQALQRARPKAITLEYNWSVRFPESVLLKEIEQVRGLASS